MKLIRTQQRHLQMQPTCRDSCDCKGACKHFCCCQLSLSLIQAPPNASRAQASAELEQHSGNLQGQQTLSSTLILVAMQQGCAVYRQGNHIIDGRPDGRLPCVDSSESQPRLCQAWACEGSPLHQWPHMSTCTGGSAAAALRSAAAVAPSSSRLKESSKLL